MEDLKLPVFVLVERDAILAEIHEAFNGVSRKGGVSWSEANVIDNYGSKRERAKARASDRDSCWQELLNDPNWNPEYASHWSFLGPIGFRYYLPAAMIKAVCKDRDSELMMHLHPRQREPDPEVWSALTLTERLCVKRFLEYMAIVEAFEVFVDCRHGWGTALNSYWNQLPGDREDSNAFPSESTQSYQ